MNYTDLALRVNNLNNIYTVDSKCCMLELPDGQRETSNIEQRIEYYINNNPVDMNYTVSVEKHEHIHIIYLIPLVESA